MTDTIKTIVLLGVCVAISVATVLFQLPPCPSEDSAMCYWNAGVHGNGMGHSFISLWEGFTIVF